MRTSMLWQCMRGKSYIVSSARIYLNPLAGHHLKYESEMETEMKELKDMSIAELRDYNPLMGSVDGLKTVYLTVPLDSFEEIVRRYRELESECSDK